MPGLHDGALLSAPGIFSLPNSFRPCFLSTAGPLSLPLPVSFTFFCLLTFHFCNPLLNLFPIFLALLYLFFMQHSLPPLCSPPCLTLHVVLILLRFSASNHCTKSHRGGGVFPQIMLEVFTRSESGKQRIVFCSIFARSLS